MSTLFLGSCDRGKIPSDRIQFLKPFHMDGLLVGKVSFRDDDRTKWRSFREGDSTEVAELQRFLKNTGFMPHGEINGVFDYVTQAAARLFQEYLRTMEEVADMVPDGIVGRMTMAHVDRWRTAGTLSEWGRASGTNASQEYNDWISLLNKAKAHYLANPGPNLTHLNAMTDTFSSRKAADWTFNTDAIHLIGVRRKQDMSIADRKNDDLFVLLINGMVFKFWGSTDPSTAMASRPDEPFLVEGQHRYRFGWHKISVERKIYRALKPADHRGVVVLRDWNNDNALTPEDVSIRGLEVNNSINIHWSGIGTTNFSAGCQVVAGKSYINHLDVEQDCSKFASRSYAGLTTGDKKTKGAYNVLMDLIMCYSKPGPKHLLYTLGREESLNLDSKFGANYAEDAFNRMQL